MKILIVDDNTSITGLLSKVLKFQGIESDVSNDGRNGLDLIERNKYDAVILDISMPEFTGIDVVNALNESGKIKENKIIILSASIRSDKDLLALKEKGVHSVLKKPVEIDTLLSILKS